MEPPELVSGRVIPPIAGISLRRAVPAFLLSLFRRFPQVLVVVRTEQTLIPILVISNIGISLL